MSKFRYLFKEGFRAIWVNRLMSIASVGVLFSCLLLIGASFMIYFNIQQVMSDLESQNVAMIYLGYQSEDGTTANLEDHQIDDIKKQITSMENVESCVFVSREEALQSTLDSMDANSKTYFDELNKENPMPDGFRVSIKDMKKFEKTVDKISKLDGVVDVSIPKDVTKMLISIRQTVTIAGLALITILFVVSMFIISNTIKITMYSRKLEINIMKAVGATDWFVRTPFIIEGMILGLLSGVLAMGALYYAYRALRVYANTGIHFLPFRSFAIPMAIGFAVIGIAAGALGSMISIGKYLRREGSEFNAI